MVALLDVSGGGRHQLLRYALFRGGLARVLAHDATQASSRRDLVGRPGVVISSQLSTQFGEVRIRDKSSHVRVICKLVDGPPVSKAPRWLSSNSKGPALRSALRR